VALAPYTSLRVGGPADFFAVAHDAAEMTAALQWARAEGVAVRVIGGGSNLLVADAGVDGLVIKASGANAEVISGAEPPRVRAAAGVTFASLARRLAKQGLGGLEWAANVPGTVGGAAVNNAGAFGGDTASVLVALRCVDADGRLQVLGADELAYAYRSSRLKRRELGEVAVVEVELRLEPSTPERSSGLVKTFNTQRMRSQPRIQSAGSVFANPDGTFAGKLIDEAGLKGRRMGGAQISEQHANFIVNTSGAVAGDVYALMRQAQQVVFERTGVWLEPEIELVGRWSEAERAALLGPRAAVPHA
jgi:UDP-N-acetylmuramate dehydrogenase